VRGQRRRAADLAAVWPVVRSPVGGVTAGRWRDRWSVA